MLLNITSFIHGNKVYLNNKNSLSFTNIQYIYIYFQQLNSTAPIIKVSNLTVGGIYKFYVVSRNENGTSLPSSILTLNMSKAAWNGITIQGKVIICLHAFLLAPKGAQGVTMCVRPPVQ